jgi:hypothetical protein
MPYLYQIDRVTNLVFIQVVNPCDVSSFIKAMETIAKDERFDDQSKILFDTSLANTPTREEINELIDVVVSMEMFRGRKVAILAEDVELYYANKSISVMANLSGTNLKVFVELQKAIQWLDSDRKGKVMSH